MGGSNFIDLTGMKFNHLTVIKRASDRIAKSGKHTTMWECQCDCGNPHHVIVDGSKLKNGLTKSCGCLKSPDLTGMRFGRLVVLGQDGCYTTKKGNREKKWVCRCDCGNVKTIIGGNLKRGKTLSCGCLNSELASQRAKKYNDYEIQEDYVIMYTLKDEPFLVDLEDFWKVKDICWSINAHGYLIGYINHREMLLHNYIMNCPDGMVVDHKYGSKTKHDNRKENLRIATHQENNFNATLSKNNTSGTTGVHWSKKRQKWVARITINYKTKYLGSFDNKEDAVKVRKEAEDKYFGEWSYDNSQKQIINKCINKQTKYTSDNPEDLYEHIKDKGRIV